MAANTANTASNCTVEMSGKTATIDDLSQEQVDQLFEKLMKTSDKMPQAMAAWQMKVGGWNDITNKKKTEEMPEAPVTTSQEEAPVTTSQEEASKTESQNPEQAHISNYFRWESEGLLDLDTEDVDQIVAVCLKLAAAMVNTSNIQVINSVMAKVAKASHKNRTEFYRIMGSTITNAYNMSDLRAKAVKTFEKVTNSSFQDSHMLWYYMYRSNSTVMVKDMFANIRIIGTHLGHALACYSRDFAINRTGSQADFTNSKMYLKTLVKMMPFDSFKRMFYAKHGLFDTLVHEVAYGAREGLTSTFHERPINYAADKWFVDYIGDIFMVYFEGNMMPDAAYLFMEAVYRYFGKGSKCMEMFINYISPELFSHFGKYTFPSYVLSINSDKCITYPTDGVRGGRSYFYPNHDTKLMHYVMVDRSPWIAERFKQCNDFHDFMYVLSRCVHTNREVDILANNITDVVDDLQPVLQKWIKSYPTIKDFLAANFVSMYDCERIPCKMYKDKFMPYFEPGVNVPQVEESSENA